MKRNEAFLTIERARQLFEIDPETGNIFWKTIGGQKPHRSTAGGIGHKGYRVIRHGPFLYKAHRIAWLLYTGEWPREQIDHANGQKDDNRKCNLRHASQSENQRNRGVQANSALGLKGVTFHGPSRKYLARVQLQKSRRHIGLFETPEEAHEAYKKEAKKLHGQFYGE